VSPPEASPAEAYVRLTGITKQYGRAPVLRGVHLAVPQNCVYGLIGPGAAGKSVLLKVLAGLVRPESGRVEVGGVDVLSLTELELADYRKRCGMAFQNYALFDTLTVAENIAFPLKRTTTLSDAEIAERVEDRLRVVSLPGYGPRAIQGLSGGQKKRVSVARAMVSKANFLLYDEPAAGLDPVTSQRIFELIRREQRAAQATVIVVSSDLDRLLTVTDRVGMLYAGRLLFDGTTSEARECTEPHVRQFVHALTDGPL
jgi:phospholipid/cholesterol/gamma-HCH transport system ATP-binding protein